MNGVSDYFIFFIWCVLRCVPKMKSNKCLSCTYVKVRYIEIRGAMNKQKNEYRVVTILFVLERNQ